ncbi:MAG TPA: thiamine-phosphate kinase [Thermodesulfobacteriaceae bacterium]|nr:thiamine-phosphate kinase [Thermodesulfobacteriaceae bacterium]
MLERRLIALIQEKAVRACPDTALEAGIGDDCAVITPSPGLQQAVTTDTFVESVHFDLDYFEPAHLGGRLAAVNLSDLAAVGAKPRWAFLNLAVPAGLSDAFWDEFAGALVSRLSNFGCCLAGGDTVASPDLLYLTLTLAGEIVPGRWLKRGTARPGDIIYCSGWLGEAAAGLRILKHEKSRAAVFRAGSSLKRGNSALPWSIVNHLVRRHLEPEPRVRLGIALAESGLATAGVDVSDGLATDLAHICRQSRVRAEIHEDALPVSDQMAAACLALKLDSVELVLSGGEDFELLWTVAEENEKRLSDLAAGILGRKPFRIGRILPGGGVYLLTSKGSEEVTFQGYEHGR